MPLEDIFNLFGKLFIQAAPKKDTSYLFKEYKPDTLFYTKFPKFIQLQILPKVASEKYGNVVHLIYKIVLIIDGATRGQNVVMTSPFKKLQDEYYLTHFQKYVQNSSLEPYVLFGKSNSREKGLDLMDKVNVISIQFHELGIDARACDLEKQRYVAGIIRYGVQHSHHA